MINTHEPFKPAETFSELTYEKLKEAIGFIFFPKHDNTKTFPEIILPPEANAVTMPPLIFHKDETDLEFRARRTAELMAVMPNGCYQLKNGKTFLSTGRGGFIQFQVTMEEDLKAIYILSPEE